MSNNNLHIARKQKNDEFYTQLSDIEKELQYYTEHLENKTVYCNCDDYRTSNFVKYFKDNFHTLKLARLIATNKDNGTGAYRYDYNGTEEKIMPLNSNGYFRSDECIEFLKEADVIVTNPPFSLFREYVKQLMDYNKKFLIIGNMNAITFKEIFPLIKDNKLWEGVSLSGTKCQFDIPEDYDGKNVFIDEFGKRKAKINNAIWFTNIEHKLRNTPFDLYKKYTGHENDYPKYDNYDAINVDKVSDIPIDYDGVMGVPITFLYKYCPSQFEIVAFRKGEDGKDLVFTREREREREREFNRTFVSLFDVDSRDDKKCRRENQWEDYLRENNNKKNKIKEPIDYFYPPSMILSGLMNNPKDTIIQGVSKYARILIKRKK